MFWMFKKRREEVFVSLPEISGRKEIVLIIIIKKNIFWRKEATTILFKPIYLKSNAHFYWFEEIYCFYFSFVHLKLQLFWSLLKSNKCSCTILQRAQGLSHSITHSSKTSKYTWPDLHLHQCNLSVMTSVGTVSVAAPLASDRSEPCCGSVCSSRKQSVKPHLQWPCRWFTWRLASNKI